MQSAIEDIEALLAMSVGELVDLYESLWGRPPRSKNKDYLRKRIAWKREEARTGGLSKKAKARLEELIAELEIDWGQPKGAVTGTLERAKKAAATLSLGTTIRRQWRGRDIVVLVRDDGRFEHEGQVYASLTGLAKAATGQHISGPAFFGLKKEKSA